MKPYYQLMSLHHTAPLPPPHTADFHTDAYFSLQSPEIISLIWYQQ